MSDQNKALHLTEDNFKETIANSKVPVLVDFYADWCGPCQMAAPIVEKLAQDETLQKKVLIAKVNIDENRAIASEYGVSSIPTFIMFKNEDKEIKLVKRETGFPGESGLKELINSAL